MTWDVTDNHWSLDDLDGGEQNLSSLSDKSRDEWLRKIQYISDNGMDFREFVEPVKHSVRKIRKRTIHAVQEIPHLPLEDGTLLYIILRSL
jgi:hypothetical protein